MPALTPLVTALLLSSSPFAPAPEQAPKPRVGQCTESASAQEPSGCQPPEAAPAAFAPQRTPEEGVVVRGEKLAGAPVVPLAELLREPSRYAGKTVQVQAHVRKACERKGCWMELAEGTGPGVRVTFKDYAFFVPTQSAGYNARVEGEVKVAELSEEQARHYESEGAHVPRGEDGRPKEVQLVARGVELRR